MRGTHGRRSRAGRRVWAATLRILVSPADVRQSLIVLENPGRAGGEFSETPDRKAGSGGGYLYLPPEPKNRAVTSDSHLLFWRTPAARGASFLKPGIGRRVRGGYLYLPPEPKNRAVTSDSHLLFWRTPAARGASFLKPGIGRRTRGGYLYLYSILEPQEDTNIRHACAFLFRVSENSPPSPPRFSKTISDCLTSAGDTSIFHVAAHAPPPHSYSGFQKTRPPRRPGSQKQ